MTEVTQLTGAALVARLQSGELTAEAVMRAFLRRIAVINPRVNAIVSMRPESALIADAQAADALRARGGQLRALHGVPFAVKDLTPVAGLRFTNGSPIYADRVAEADSIMVARLRAAGAIFIGKTNVPEYGLGSHSFNPVFGTTRNPYDLSKSAGGSSGGAAAALAARLVPLADGGDMMGSLRNPAAFCNIYGFRPSTSLLADEGRAATPAAERLVTLGPMGRTVADVALLLDVQAGPDARDPFSWGPARPFARAILDGPPSPLRIGWLGDFGGAYAYEAGVLARCGDCLLLLESGLGAAVTEVTPVTPASTLWHAWTTLRSKEAAAMA